MLLPQQSSQACMSSCWAVLTLRNKPMQRLSVMTPMTYSCRRCMQRPVPASVVCWEASSWPLPVSVGALASSAAMLLARGGLQQPVVVAVPAGTVQIPLALMKSCNTRSSCDAGALPANSHHGNSGLPAHQHGGGVCHVQCTAAAARKQCCSLILAGCLRGPPASSLHSSTSNRACAGHLQHRPCASRAPGTSLPQSWGESGSRDSSSRLGGWRSRCKQQRRPSGRPGCSCTLSRTHGERCDGRMEERQQRWSASVSCRSMFWQLRKRTNTWWRSCGVNPMPSPVDCMQALLAA